MTAYKIKAIEDFYELSALLDDDLAAICNFICEKIPKEERRFSRKQIKRYVFNANYVKIYKEVDYLLYLPQKEYLDFTARQTTIFDFMKGCE